jgi:hypothetical protein
MGPFGAGTAWTVVFGTGQGVHGGEDEQPEPGAEWREQRQRGVDSSFDVRRTRSYRCVSEAEARRLLGNALFKGQRGWVNLNNPRFANKMGMSIAR